ncbi:DUF418 domain-containing protein [Sphingosinicella sp. BN140058]|uniref:DUF418 domain-containing protein n=1 Tax=Sphingosinicella sp. BN140058 TaxID=1892855 RepID=UPI001011E25A|nr:DUF418 domain-containing protein [Sphingosinicella sp. BN140058]QAY77748.1 DUF418 domain-containing protein [Sphingosinicella sp. BN140058]
MIETSRIATLDIVRGVAVMGILAMNIVDFAMPPQAYMNPAAYGLTSGADLAAWVFAFVFIDGKMRGLFSFLFGASMLLVIQGAETKGENATAIHYRRMLWLGAIGLLHYYLLWHGDILFGYAFAGMIAALFHDKAPRALVVWGIGLVLIQFALFAAISGSFFLTAAAAAEPGSSAEALAAWRDVERSFGRPDGAEIAKELALYRGSYPAILQDRFTVQLFGPFKGLLLFSWETLGYMLFGMAALKTGFLSGAWAARRYARVALIGFAIGIPYSALLAWLLIRAEFDAALLFAIWGAATVPVRPLMILATAAAIILLTRRSGPLVTRIAAAGRAAFTNYLGTSILMTSLFFGYGLGLFGHLSRIELWLIVLPTWALMLLWSKPWLDRFRYGPLEWAWRSLARGALQPMRRSAEAAAD